MICMFRAGLRLHLRIKNVCHRKTYARASTLALFILSSTMHCTGHTYHKLRHPSSALCLLLQHSTATDLEESDEMCVRVVQQMSVRLNCSAMHPVCCCQVWWLDCTDCMCIVVLWQVCRRTCARAHFDVAAHTNFIYHSDAPQTHSSMPNMLSAYENIRTTSFITVPVKLPICVYAQLPSVHVQLVITYLLVVFAFISSSP